MPRNRKVVVTIFVTAIVLIAVIGVAPAVFSAFSGPGVKTEGLTADHAKPATTDVDGTWTVRKNKGDNATSVGYTFPEVLPGDRRVTSASTQEVVGQAVIEAGKLKSADISIDMTGLSSDNERRDVNVRNKIFATDEYPTATFALTEPVDVSSVPEDATVGQVTLNGDLTIRGETEPVTADFDVLRDRDRVVIAGTIPINRLDFGVETPEFVAATIAEDGEINIRLTLRKEEG